MNSIKNSAAAYFDRVATRGPVYLELLTSPTIEEFEAAFTALLERAVIHLEKNKKNYKTLKETGLCGNLAAFLTIPGVMNVSQESNSNGHVDLTIEVDGCTPTRIKLGEAKIYSGPVNHMKGMQQLIERYTTGRETAGLMINFVRQPNIKEITEKLRVAMDKRLPLKQTGPSAPHALQWSLATKHNHSSGEEIPISHIGCNLY